MKALFIGGTGTISTEITKLLLKRGCELYLLNRGNRNEDLPGGAHILQGDINDEEKVKELIAGHEFDVVADFIAFVPEQVERDYRLFKDKTKQYIFISSASAYQSPPADYRINEGTPLANPFWEYSRDKIACEEYLMKQYREQNFPVTIVRPSHTYSERSVPIGVHGSKGPWQVLKRIQEGKPVIIHGDGASLWTVTHSRDFAVGFAGLMGNVHAIGEAVQITSDESVTWNQIHEIVASVLGKKLNALHVSSEFLDAVSEDDLRGSLLGDKANTVVFDNSKIKRLVPEFSATTRADQGLREAVEYMLAHPESQQEDPDFDAWSDRVASALEKAIAEINKG
ncbi:SDR family oxidoreductase [Saccharibacillus sp. CPCC 101409]|uniref:SDR family oxidoreductase n=1 Tax=Saccharibacillus sp. CPCC 101409 TaxID=3058041 RepID=UPI002670E498|nr:SDR family oxidoreductase [Saccharibacillus sp. CPCC 101409]MDO3409909.1 SDR family oxidoreductase [Saccharibacillus sp. CPCC 101409]